MPTTVTQVEAIRAELYADDIPCDVIALARLDDLEAVRRFFELGGEQRPPPTPLPTLHRTMNIGNETASAMDLELAPPPPKLAPAAEIAAPIDAAIRAQLHAGVKGSSCLSFSELVSRLAASTACCSEPESFAATFSLWSRFTSRRLADTSWCDAYSFAAEHVARAGALEGSGPAIVVVLGLGMAIPAIVAARCGANVIWVERVASLAKCAERLARRNGVGSRVRVLKCADYMELKPPLVERRAADAVITEAFDETDLLNVMPRLAAHARQWLLREGGRVIPSGVSVRAQLCSVRTTTCQGFDLRAMNAFRSPPVFQDIEHILATDQYRQQSPRILSSPIELFSLSFGTGRRDEKAAITAAHMVQSSQAGVLNCVSTWHVLEFGGGCRLDCGCVAGPPFRPRSQRALDQPLVYLGVERLVDAGETVRFDVRHNGSGSLAIELLEAAKSERQRFWPQMSSLAYHLPMISDVGRNSAFEATLRDAIATHTRQHGRPPHVLDIGAGSGLLAMMAARHGAGFVTTVEMVPTLAATARHVIAANGFDSCVRVVEGVSTELHAHELQGANGEAADLLVCEIVDDAVLGEGVLASVLDARRRLLKPGAPCIPLGATVYALAVSLHAPERRGLRLEELSFACDQVLSSGVPSGLKLQQLPSEAYTALAQPVELFSLDFGSNGTNGPSVEIDVIATNAGALNAFVVWFRLHLDATHEYSSGPDNPSAVAWDQCVFHLPVEVRVAEGEVLPVWAYHTRSEICMGLREVGRERLNGIGHIDEFAPEDAGDGGTCRVLAGAFSTAPYPPVRIV